MSKTKNIVLFSLIFLAGIVSGLILDKENNFSLSVASVREESTNYRFISPLLFTQALNDQEFPEYSALRKEISRYVDDSAKHAHTTDISVYFRNLEGGQWISVNPGRTFSPASMLKVITLLGVLRMAESNPKILTRNVTLEGDDEQLVDAQSFYQADDPIRSGNSYTIETLLKHLITESDNVANAALLNFVGIEKIRKTYEDLQLPYPDSTNQDRYTPEVYSHIFRVLYNGTYLSRTYSEKALELLSKTKFVEGLVAGVPEDTLVSHKFGVRTVLEEQSQDGSHDVVSRELHDCGIVYYPDNPYFICVMTSGKEFSQLESVIETISSIVWKYQDKLHVK